MTKDVGCDRFDIFGQDMGAAVEEGEAAGSADDLNSGAGRGSGRDEWVEAREVEPGLAFRKLGAAFGPGGEDDVENVVLDLGIDMDLVDERAGQGDGFERGDGGGTRDARGRSHTAKNFAFLIALGITNDDFHHETVHLSFGKGVGPFLIERVLGRHNEERVRQFGRFATEGDLLLLHGLEEGGLNLGGSAVDFVGKEEVGENGASFGGKFLGSRVVDVGADNVGRKEIGGELDSPEVGRESLSQSSDGEGLGESGETFDEKVVSGEKTDEHAIDEVVLPDEDACDFLPERCYEGGVGLDFCGEFFRSHEGVTKNQELVRVESSTIIEKSDRAIPRK